jgi:S-DNA-T family DNA segregation ATPase FtsK/SpoIIIE
MDLTDRDGNFIVVGPAGSGKTLCLHSLVLALAATHPPGDLLFYFLSRGASLSLFEELPHCQAFIRSRATERITRLFTFLEGEIVRHTELLRTNRADNMMALRRLRPDIPLPSLVVIFDDFAGFIGEHHDRLRELESMASAAGQVDLHLILSVASINSIHARIQQNIQNRLALGQTYT